MRRLTLSRYHIARQCTHFLREDVEWTEKANTYTRVGSATHTVSEGLTNGELPDVAAIAEAAGMTKREKGTTERLVQRYVDFYATQNTEGWESEVKLAWNPFSDEYIQIKSTAPRDYSELDDIIAIAGTADTAYALDDDDGTIAGIDDVKTGFGGKVDPFWQGSGLVMMQAARLRTDRGRFRVIPVKEDEETRPRVFDFSRADIEDTKHDLRQILRAALNEPEPREGPWCSYCPARLTCKATQHATESAMTLIPEGSLVRHTHKLELVPRDDEHARWTYSAIRLARGLLDAAEEGLRGFVADRNGLDLPDGTLLKAWDKSTRVLEMNEEGERILRKLGLDQALEKKATIQSVTRAAGGKKEAEGVLKQLEAVGAITLKPGSTFEPRKPPKGRAA